LSGPGKVLPRRIRSACGALLLACAAWPASAAILLIGNKGEDTLGFVDLVSGRQCARLATGKAPHEIAVSPNGRQAVVVGYGEASIDIFDIARARLLRRIDIAPNEGPHGIAWIGQNRILAVTDRGNSLVSIDPRTGAFVALPTGQRGSHMLAVSSDKRRAYTTNILSGTVGVFDLERWTKLSDIAVGGNPEALAIAPGGATLWVGDNSGPRVKVVDLATGAVTATLPADSIAIRLAVSPDGRTVVASNFLSGSLTVYDARNPRLLRSLPVSGERQAMQVTLAWSVRPGHILVAETGRNAIAEVDLKAGRVLRRIQAGKNGDGLAIAPGTCRPSRDQAVGR
jgi:DNA-binding beta-propeller fold protein YncE